jgi:patatin-like phospholipase/acyl hydrolase
MDPGKKMKDEADKLRILSIDGGGVRGVIPATILKYLEEELQRIDKSKDRRLAEYFDLIVGTSTGGLITALITTPRLKKDDPQELPLSAEQVLEFYQTNTAKIFAPAR